MDHSGGNSSRRTYYSAIVIAVYSSGHFAKGTKVNGIDVSGMSVKQLQKRIGEYSINVKERKIDEKSRDESFFEETIKGRDIGLAVGDAQPLYDILKGQGFIKFFAGDKKDYEISHTLSYDKDLLAKEVSALKGASATDGTEAVSASVCRVYRGKKVMRSFRSSREIFWMSRQPARRLKRQLHH